MARFETTKLLQFATIVLAFSGFGCSQNKNNSQDSVSTKQAEMSSISPTASPTPQPTPSPSFSFVLLNQPPTSVVQGQTVTIQLSATTAVALSNGIMDIAIDSANGTQVALYDVANQKFTAGVANVYQASLTIPSTAATGEYSVFAGVFTPTWSATYPGAGVVAKFAVTSAPAPTPSPSPSPKPSPSPTPTPSPSFSFVLLNQPPTSVVQGQTVTIQLNATTPVALSNGIMDIEIDTTAGVKVAQYWVANQTFSAGVAKEYTTSLTIPSTAATGEYQIFVGVFTSTWSATYPGAEVAAKFAVTSAPAPTPSPSPSPKPSPSPTPTPSPSFSFVLLNQPPTSVVQGQTVTIQLSATTAVALSNGIMDIAIDSANGTQVALYDVANQKFTAGVANVYQASLTIPSTAATGEYSVFAGVFTPTWSATYPGAGVIAKLAVNSAPAPTPSSTPSPTPSPSAYAGLNVSMGVGGAPGHIVNAAGEVVQLRGVDRSGTEYACISGWGFFDGPSDQASLTAMRSWGVNAVRVPLNEDCWLAINGAPAAYSGASYKAAISQYVNLLNSNGMYAILDLHWNAPGTTQSAGQQVMADSDHAPLFWSQVATAFANSPMVIFDLYNEPNLNNEDWACWLNGGACSVASNASFSIAGMKTLYNSVRATGAKNIVMMGGLSDANDFSGWVSAVKSISGGTNIAASWHSYDFGSIQSGCPSQFNGYSKDLTCNSPAVTAANSSVPSVLSAGYPIIMGESGISPVANDTNFSAQQIQYIETWYSGLLSWMDSQGQGYLAWAWNSDGSPMLIQDYTGTPTVYFGTTYKNHIFPLSQ